MKKIVAILLICSVFACKKKTPTQNAANNPVPSVLVNYTIYPGDPLNFKIQSIGGWMYVEGYGINGMIIYRKSQEEFVAIERTSAYLPNNAAARVVVQKDNFTLRDTVSGSQWRIFDGTVTQGPTQWGLRIYGSSYNGSSLVVRN